MRMPSALPDNTLPIKLAIQMLQALVVLCFLYFLREGHYNDALEAEIHVVAAGMIMRGSDGAIEAVWIEPGSASPTAGAPIYCRPIPPPVSR